MESHSALQFKLDASEQDGSVIRKIRIATFDHGRAIYQNYGSNIQTICRFRNYYGAQ